jgi:hypothetical protein
MISGKHPNIASSFTRIGRVDRAHVTKMSTSGKQRTRQFQLLHQPNKEVDVKQIQTASTGDNISLDVVLINMKVRPHDPSCEIWYRTSCTLLE